MRTDDDITWRYSIAPAQTDPTMVVITYIGPGGDELTYVPVAILKDALRHWPQRWPA